MKSILKAIFLILALGLSFNAHAGKLIFGTQDTIKFVANTTLPGPEGSRLFLGHRVTTHAFLLPYYVESKGLVFGVSGESKKYIPLPQNEKLVVLQAAGFLPQVLPKAELSIFDYVLGFALEILLIAGIGYLAIKKVFAN